MGKFSLAAKLADEVGKSSEEALRFINDVGMSKAQGVADDLATKGSRTVAKWWKPTAATGGIAGGGALAWRQQDLEQARAIAEQQRKYGDAVGEIMASDLPPDRKAELVDQLRRAGENGDGDGGDDGGGPAGGLLGSDIQTTLVLVILAAFAFRYTLGDDD